MIVLEGVDASGKSTLAKIISERFGWPIQPSEGPPHFPGEMNQRVEKYMHQGPRIYDRHPCVSQIIYGKMRSHLDPIDDWRIDLFYKSCPIFIYCEPGNKGLNGHVHKPNQYDSPEHLANVDKNYDALLVEYRRWAIDHANFIYRIGDNMMQLAELVHSRFYGSFDPVTDIEQFHRRYLLEYDGPPRHLPPDISTFRVQFLAEELCEYVGLNDLQKQLIQSTLIKGTADVSKEDQFDALIDLVYVALGTTHLHGFDFREGWRRVHAANMTKIRTKNASDSKRGSTYDVVKPTGWKPPSLSDLVGA